MNGHGTGNEFIDQAFFGFNHDGLTIVASSLPSDDDELRWKALLKQHVRLRSHPEIPLPPHALSYFLFSSEVAAVLRRVKHGDSEGRNNSHVLIGPPQVLTAQVALGLELWPDWQADPPANRRRMNRLRSSQLDCGLDPADALRAQVKDKSGDLERVLGWLLETPGQPLSIIGCPAEDRVALLWGLMEIGAPVLQSHKVLWAWTFSTYETDHGDAIQYLPEIVCLPAKPVGTSVASRTSVDLTHGGPASPPAANRARELVEQYVHGRPAPAEPVPAPQLVRQSTLAPAVSAPSAPSPADHPDIAEMVRSLMAAQHSEDFYNRLDAIEHASNPHNREIIRKELDSRDYGIELINRIMPSTAHEAAFKLLITVAFGSSLIDFDNVVVRRYVERLVESSPSDEFIRTLAQMAKMNNRHNQISPLVAQRWPGQQKSTDLDQAVRDLPERTPSAGTNKHSAKPILPGLPVLPVLPDPAELLKRYKGLIVTSGWIVSLLLSFVFGLFAASSTTSSPPAASPTPGTPEPAAMDRPDAVVTRMAEDAKTGTMQINATLKQELPGDKQLWLLVERGDGTKFPQPKPCSPGGANWKCTQVYNFPDAAATDYRITFVIADQNAAKSLGGYDMTRPKDTPGKGIEELPLGATETDLTLIDP